MLFLHKATDCYVPRSVIIPVYLSCRGTLVLQGLVNILDRTSLSYYSAIYLLLTSMSAANHVVSRNVKKGPPAESNHGQKNTPLTLYSSHHFFQPQSIISQQQRLELMQR